MKRWQKVAIVAGGFILGLYSINRYLNRPQQTDNQITSVPDAIRVQEPAPIQFLPVVTSSTGEAKLHEVAETPEIIHEGIETKVEKAVAKVEQLKEELPLTTEEGLVANIKKLWGPDLIKHNDVICDIYFGLLKSKGTSEPIQRRYYKDEKTGQDKEWCAQRVFPFKNGYSLTVERQTGIFSPNENHNTIYHSLETRLTITIPDGILEGDYGKGASLLLTFYKAETGEEHVAFENELSTKEYAEQKKDFEIKGLASITYLLQKENNFKASYSEKIIRGENKRIMYLVGPEEQEVEGDLYTTYFDHHELTPEKARELEINPTETLSRKDLQCFWELLDYVNRGILGQ